MPTETDLRAALFSLEQDAPTTEDVLAGLQLHAGRQRPAARRRRWTVAIPAAAVAALAITVLAVVLAPRHHVGPSAPKQVQEADGAGVPTYAAPTDLTFGFTVDPVGGYTITPAQVLPHLWQASVRSTTSSDTNGAVTVFATGAFDAATVSKGKAVTVNGRAGFFGPVADPLGGTGTAPLDAVTWQYAPDSWAMVRIDFGQTTGVLRSVAEAQELAIARAVHPGHLQVLRIPFRVGYLPARVFAVSASGDTDPQGGALGLADGRGTADTAPFQSAITIWVDNARDPNLVFCPSGDPAYVRFTLRGHTGCFFHNGPGGAVAGLQVDLDRGHVEILVAADHAGIYSSAQLLRIAASITTAPDLASPDTWFDARTALP